MQELTRKRLTQEAFTRKRRNMHFREVILQTASIHRTKLFYHKTLELPVTNETDDTISFQAGDSVLTFKAVTGQKPFYHIAFNITNNKFSDSFEWMNNKLDILPMENGLPIAVYPEWNAESFYFYDNNGSILEFISRFDLPSYSPAPFSPADIKEISEVGIAAGNVKETAEELNKSYQIPYFSKSKPSEHFTVLGDDHGLFIITSTGRPWVPTNKPAQHFPIIVITDEGKIEL
jgi:catechol-2,3-dioxygenase